MGSGSVSSSEAASVPLDGSHLALQTCVCVWVAKQVTGHFPLGDGGFILPIQIRSLSSSSEVWVFGEQLVLGLRYGLKLSSCAK